VLKALWKRACRWDDVATDLRGRHRYDDCKFVCFSDENPHDSRRSRIVRLVLAAQ
jgi:hypothetical protein